MIVSMSSEFVSGRSIQTEILTGQLYSGIGPGPHYGVLVLHGSGGAGGYERAYAERLAEHGYTALCVEYFDAPGVSDVLADIPLSYFADAAEWLLNQQSVAGQRVGVVGFSRGAEAALLVGAQFGRIGVVIAYVPSCYAFPAPTWMGGIDNERAAWTLDRNPIPYLPVDEYVEGTHDGAEEALGADTPNASKDAVEQATDDELSRATIEVEEIEGPILLISGGADRVWPSMEFADHIVDRLNRHNHSWSAEHLAYPEAGHAIRVPYRFEASDSIDSVHRFGGTNEANAYASAEAWYAALRHLQKGLSR